MCAASKALTEDVARDLVIVVLTPEREARPAGGTERARDVRTAKFYPAPGYGIEGRGADIDTTVHAIAATVPVPPPLVWKKNHNIWSSTTAGRLHKHHEPDQKHCGAGNGKGQRQILSPLSKYKKGLFYDFRLSFLASNSPVACFALNSPVKNYIRRGGTAL